MNTTDATITDDTQPELETELTDVTISSKAFCHYRGLLRILSGIHNDTAERVNQLRTASKAAFFRREDEFIPEHNHNDLLALAIEAEHPIPASVHNKFAKVEPHPFFTA